MRKVMLACTLAAFGLLAVGCDSNTPATNKGGPNPAAAGAAAGAKARESGSAGGMMTPPTGSK